MSRPIHTSEDQPEQQSFGTAPPTWKAAFSRCLAKGLYYSGLFSSIRRLEKTQRLDEDEAGALPRLRRFGGSKFGILCYHRVGTEGVPLYSRLDPRVFARQMRYIKRHYRVVPLSRLCTELVNRDQVSPTLAVTFDDGYRDLYSHAFPVLRKYQIPATVYLISQCMETGEAPWYDRIFAALQAFPGESIAITLGKPQTFQLTSPEVRLRTGEQIVGHLRMLPDLKRRLWCSQFERDVRVPEVELRDRILNWAQVREMHAGGVSFGAHTATHPFVSRLDPEDLESELGRSRRELEMGLQDDVRDFAYPFGKPQDCSIAAERFLIANRYRSAVTTTEQCNTAGSSLYRLCRLSVAEDTSLPYFAFRVSRMFLDCAPEGEPSDAEPLRASNMMTTEAERPVGANNA